MKPLNNGLSLEAFSQIVKQFRQLDLSIDPFLLSQVVLSKKASSGLSHLSDACLYPANFLKFKALFFEPLES